MSKHTQGQWTVEVFNGDAWWIDEEIRDENGDAIAFISQDCSQANARLIAAAPEMYEALKALLSHANAYSDFMAEKYGHGDIELGELADSTSIAGRARAALAKAEEADDE